MIANPPPSAARIFQRAAAITAITFAPLLLASVLAVFGLVWDFTLSLLYVFVPLLAVVAMAGSMLALVWRPRNAIAVTAIATGLMVCVLLLPMFWVSWQLRMLGYRYAAQRAQPVATAVERFLAAHGRLPSSLAELLPQYLAAMPQRLPPLQLHGADYFTGQPWALEAACGVGFCDFLTLAYLPIRSEPSFDASRHLVGNWICIQD